MKLELKDINPAYYDLSDSVKQTIYTILYGGRNSSKTHSVIQWLLRTLWNEKANAIWYRKHSADLLDKAYEPIKNIAANMDIDSALDFRFSNFRREIVFPKDNKLLFDFVDEKGKSKGISNIRYIIIDEIDQISLTEFSTIVTSFRGDDRIRFIFLFNPVSEKHWLKKTFFDNLKNEPTHYSNYTKAFHYTIEDNKFATAMDYINLDALKSSDMNAYRVNRLGLWGTISVDDPYYDAFNYNEHVVEDKIPFFTGYPLYLFWDFGKADNCLVSQVFDAVDIESDISLKSYFSTDSENAVTHIQEFSVGKAVSNIQVICDRMIDRFGTEADYRIGGDTAGGGNDITDIYAEIRNCFEARGCGFVFFLKRYKPNHKSSRRLNSWVMRTYKRNFRVSLPDCPQLIEDYQKVRVDEFGGINKADCIAHNIGHVADCSRYTLYITQLAHLVRRNPYLGNGMSGATEIENE